MSELQTFNHFGMIGDIMFSLYFCLEIAHHYDQDKFNFHIQTNAPFKAAPCEEESRGKQKVYLNNQAAQFIKPLLEAQPYINQVTYGPKKPEGAWDLNEFRNLKFNLGAGDLRDYYYHLVANFLPKEFWKKLLFVNPNNKYKDKILITLSQRYVNCFIKFKQAQQFKDHLVFIGTEKEHKIFCQKYFQIPSAGKFDSLLQIAQLIEGARGYIANPTGLYAVAELLKVPRMLIQAEYVKVHDQILFGPKNVFPLGGLCTTCASTDNFLKTLNLMTTQL